MCVCRRSQPLLIPAGYSGTAVFTRDGLDVVSVKEGLGIDEHDREGRTLTVEFDSFFLVHVYVPNAGGGLKRCVRCAHERSTHTRAPAARSAPASPALTRPQAAVSHGVVGPGVQRTPAQTGQDDAGGANGTRTHARTRPHSRTRTHSTPVAT